jgi:enterochelin esterase-like enzyme
MQILNWKSMKMMALFLSVFLCSMDLFAQSIFHDFLLSIDSVKSKAERLDVINNYLPIMESFGLPFIEGDTANFIYYAPAATVILAGDFNGWSDFDTLVHIDSTDFFYHRQPFEPTARLDYKFIVDGSWILDPENPNTCTGGFGPNSELAMPAYVQPWEIISYPGVNKGSVSSFAFHSSVMNKNYAVQVYLPPGYDNSGNTAYPVLYVHDGQEYISLAGMNNILDNLLDSNKIDPVIGVFLRPTNRNEEYGFSLRYDYSDFIVEEIVPYIDANYPTLKLPACRLTMGTSLGGNISGLIAYKHPDVFGNCGMHSPALWVNDLEVAKWFTDSIPKDIRLYYIGGTYEDLGFDLSDFADSLDSKGYDFSWSRYPEGHSWGLWRATCDEILTFFFPAGSVPLSITNNNMAYYGLGQNYPNPFSTSAIIPITITQAGWYTLSLFSSTGRLIRVVADQFLTPSGYTFKITASALSPGVYYYTLVAPGGVGKKSMVIVK